MNAAQNLANYGAPMELVDLIAGERRALVDVLDSLTPEQLASPSCCDRWSVIEVASHLTQGWTSPTFEGLWRMIKARGDIGKVSDQYVAEGLAAGPQSVIDDLRRNIDNPWKPPGFNHESPLADLVIHRHDISLPLGITTRVDPLAVKVALDLAVRRGVMARVNRSKQLGGLRLIATDIEWTHGSGPEVAAPALPLAHALWGRSASFETLEGSGVRELTTRLSSPSA